MILSYSFMVIIPLYLSSLFIYKLIIVYRQDHSDNDANKDILPLITKNTILATCCNISSLFLAMSVVLVYSAPSISSISAMISWSFIFMYILSNFLCISLSYRYNIKYYSLICGHLDNLCASCFGNNNLTNIQQELAVHVDENGSSN